LTNGRVKNSSIDVLEITVDHCSNGSKSTQSAIFDLVGTIPLTAHGIGFSSGVPIDLYI
jgi:hypothetical protein